MAALRFTYLLCLVVWIGGIVFFSFFTAPALFTALPRDMAGRVTALLFPRYYLLGGACGSIALLALMLLRLRGRSSGRLQQIEMLLLILMLAMTMYAGLAILPETSSLRPQLRAVEDDSDRAAAQRRFDVLHRRSVVLNGLVLLCGIGLLATIAGRAKGGAMP